MKIDVLEISSDGKQSILAKEVPDIAQPVAEKIEELKAQLSASDYKVIKCSEYSLAGLPAPYDIVSLNTERQAIRDQINALEEK